MAGLSHLPRVAISVPIYSVLCFKDTEALGACIALTQHTEAMGAPASEGPGCRRGGGDFILFPALTLLWDPGQHPIGTEHQCDRHSPS